MKKSPESDLSITDTLRSPADGHCGLFCKGKHQIFTMLKICFETVAYFTKEVNPSLAKSPLKFNSG